VGRGGLKRKYYEGGFFLKKVIKRKKPFRVLFSWLKDWEKEDVGKMEEYHSETPNKRGREKEKEE